MRYQKYDLIQNTTFSCLEELKCDVIEYLINPKSQMRGYGTATIILPSELARMLYTKFLQADVNGFKMKLFEEYTDVEVTQILVDNEYVLLSVDNEGQIFFDAGKVYDCTGEEKNDLVYLHEYYCKEWFPTLKRNAAYTLVWRIE